VKTVRTVSVEGAAKHLNGRDIDGVIVGDGLSPLMIDAFLAALADDARFRDLPVAVIGRLGHAIPATLPNVDHVAADARTIVARMLPMIRLHAFGSRLARALAALDAGGAIDAETGLMTPDAFAHELSLAIAAASDRSQPLSLAHFSFDGLDARAAFEAARMVTRLVRTVDFAGRDETGAILMAFTQTDLRSAHVIARRIAGALKSAMPGPAQAVAANVTLATWKAGDTVDTLMLRVLGTHMVAAE
jgi:GGDEF domain-containing protein